MRDTSRLQIYNTVKYLYFFAPAIVRTYNPMTKKPPDISNKKDTLTRMSFSLNLCI